ncbi:threonine/serine exporter family protein [Seleniivibrio woodruffii]|uniref:threonine/serine exporter family protein n=1 Tax=Seleniivibrio woodruffii TaxID=1078050 RepID=UPI0026EAF137|nr:threonine/serine exporter family protein [Seleniivibrio woodruffii]
MNTFKIITECLFAAVPAVGFAVAFNVPPKYLKFCAIGGALGFLVRSVMMEYGVQISLATFTASILVSFYAVLWAQKSMAHPRVISVASIIPMIPGVYAYKTMIAIVELANRGYDMAMMQSAVENGLKTFFILGAIAFGLAIPGLLIYRGKPVV